MPDDFLNVRGLSVSFFQEIWIGSVDKHLLIII